MTIKRKTLEILPVMIGTAGHVDHGKTELVKNLTGCDTDRLREEKERGLTIDLGFAPCHFDGGRLAGIVDVPGHEDFIRNMAAGAASIDVLLLTIAADDGVMPQTREHLTIVRMLTRPILIVVLTKIDLVDEGRLAEVAKEIGEFLAANGFGDAPVVPVSNVSLDGIKKLRATIEDAVGRVEKRRDDRAFRMYVERVFNVKGFGTVATGIPLSGSLAAGKNVVLLPEGKTSGVRAVQSYQQQTDTATAGACAALNLRDLKPEEIERGMVLAEPEAYPCSNAALVTFRNMSDVLDLRHNMEVRFHTGTKYCVARARVVGGDTIGAGGEGFLQLLFSENLVLAAGDTCVIRLSNPNATIGGGTVITAGPGRCRRSSDALVARLNRAKEELAAGHRLLAALYGRQDVVIGREDLLRLTQMSGDGAARAVTAATQSGHLVEMGGGYYAFTPRIGELAEKLQRDLERYHAQNPKSAGMDKSLAAGAVGLDGGCGEKLLAALTGFASFRIRGGVLALAGFSPAVTQRQAEVNRRVLDSVRENPTTPPAVGNIAKEIGAEENEIREAVKTLSDEGAVVRIGNNLFGMEIVARSREALAGLQDTHGRIEIPTFRAATGLGRNMAVALLEYFDARGVTKRTGEGRRLVERRKSADN